MAIVSYPGVYIEELPSAAKPVQLAGASTAALVGLAEKGPVGVAVRITSWDEYRRRFGGFVANSFLAESVFAYFGNGGRECDIVRIVRADAAAADVIIKNRADTPAAGVRFTARNPGTWANALLLGIEDGSLDPGNEFKLTIRQQADPAVVPDLLDDLQVLEVHDNLGVDPEAPNYFADVLKRNSELVQAAPISSNNVLQAGFVLGADLLTTEIPRPSSSSLGFKISVNGNAFQTVLLTVPAASASYTWDDLANDIAAKVVALRPNDPAYRDFKCVQLTDNTAGRTRLRLTSGTVDAVSAVLVQAAASNNISDRLGLGSGVQKRREGGLARRRPMNASRVQLGDAQAGDEAVAASSNPVSPRLGSDGARTLSEADYAAGFSALDGRTDVSLLLAPGVGTPGMLDEGQAYCQNRPLQDMFYIGEVGGYDETPDSALDFQRQLAKRTSYGALYFPWVRSVDPSGRSATPIRLPPSGFIAGLYARTDAARGVWKAPAGTEASLSNVVGLVTDLTDIQQGRLNPIGINAIRRIGQAGVVVWGARTVSADPEYRYVPVRRLAIMLRRSIYDGIQWAVFEPNDDRLWAALRLNIESMMNGLFRAGAFQGTKASDAYAVRCGLGDTMTQGDIDRGQVIVEVAFAPVKPAEFVIVRIQQKAGQQ